MELIVLIITNIISPVVVGFITYALTKKKYESEVEANLIANMKDSLNFYQLIVKDNQEKLQELLDKNESLESKVEELKNEINLLYQISCMKSDCNMRIPHSCMLKNRLKNVYEDYEDKLD